MAERNQTFEQFLASRMVRVLPKVTGSAMEQLLSNSVQNGRAGSYPASQRPTHLASILKTPAQPDELRNQ